MNSMQSSADLDGLEHAELEMQMKRGNLLSQMIRCNNISAEQIEKMEEMKDKTDMLLRMATKGISAGKLPS